MMHVLVETEDTSSISSPLKTTNRIKFLSLSVSESYIVFGASSGGLYVYDRESFAFKALVPSKEGPITCVRISPDEKWFGFSTTRGVSCVLEHSGSAVNRRILSHVHEGRSVTALQWNNLSSQLYIGDNSGQISVISVSSYLTPAVALMQLDSAIVQLDTCSYMLLASTTTRSFLCDTFREQYRQIGNRLRDGEFGGCFYHVDAMEPLISPVLETSRDQEGAPGPFSSLSDGEWLLADNNLQNVKLFCSRPGLRLWEVRIDGAVMNTHQFKQLRHTPPVNVIRPPEVGIYSETMNLPHQSQTLQFKKLCNLANKYILTYDANGLCVLDPMTSEIILWTDQFKNILDVHVVDDVMYLWMGDSKLHAVSFTPIDKFLVRMYLQRRYLYCAQLCAVHVSTLKKLAHISLKLHILVDLLQKVKEEETGNSLDEDATAKIHELLDEVSKTAQNQDQAQMLKSGIFIVGNAHLLSQNQKLGVHKPCGNISQKSQAYDAVDILPSLLRRQEGQTQENGHSGEGTMNGVFKNSILPSISSIDKSNGNSDEDFDPFPDLPLSSLTSAETIMALKSLTTTVSGTITNGTKSLREKWQSIEERLRGQEESGLGVEKSINRSGVQVPNLFENCDEEDRNVATSHKKATRLPISSLVDYCTQIESHQNGNRVNLEELQFKMLDSFLLLYDEFMKSSTMEETGKSVAGSSEDKESVFIIRKWLNCSNTVPFPFHDHFEKEFVTTLSLQFQVCLASGALSKWLSEFLSQLELDYSLFPSHIGRIHSKNALLLDQVMGRFLGICSGLLEPYSALQSLEDSGCTCNYFSWNVIVDYFHKSSSTSFASAPDRASANTDTHSWSLPRTLNAMLVLLQLGQVQSCRNIGNSVPTRYILRTMLKLKENSTHLSKLFLTYLEKVQEEDLLASLEDKEVYYFTRKAFESLHQVEPREQCSCGFPLKEVDFDRPFLNVGLALITSVYKSSGLVEAIMLCQKTGVLWHFLLTLRRGERVEEVLPLILHTGCVEELKKRCGELLSSGWDLVFQLRSDLEEGLCLNCHTRSTISPKSIPWMSLAYLLLSEMDSDFALALLSKYSKSIPSGSINLQFYQSCLLASVAESHSAQTKRDLLDSLVDSHALPAISPKVADKLGLPLSGGQHHWGLELQLAKNQCCYCLLPLASSSGGSVVVFQCRHSFHSVCLQQQLLKLCPICAKF